MISIVWPAAGMIITNEHGLDDMVEIVPCTVYSLTVFLLY
jgi:hypothetical protein